MTLGAPQPTFAEDVGPRVITYHGYTQAIELKRGNTRAVLCSQAGGRVLEFSVDGRNAMFLDEEEKNWRPGKTEPISAGRFDFGPELTVIAHPETWSGQWSAKITGMHAATLTSPVAQAAGIQLVREFKLVEHGTFIGLSCKQTMINVSKEIREPCHWGRSFSPGGGICV